jgi:hypothetical protein
VSVNFGKTTAPDGLLKVLLKPGEDGKTVIKTKQKGWGVAGYTGGLASLARTPPVTVQLISSTGECFLLRTSYFVLLTSYFVLLTSYFVLLTSYFLLRTSYFLLRTSNLVLRTSF